MNIGGGGGGGAMICSGDGRSEVGERGSVTYVYVYEHEDVSVVVSGVTEVMVLNHVSQ